MGAALVFDEGLSENQGRVAGGKGQIETFRDRTAGRLREAE